MAQRPEQRQGFVQLVTNETARRKRRKLDDWLHEDMTVGVDLNESAVRTRCRKRSFSFR